MGEMTFLKTQVSEFNAENLKLKSEVSYLKGKIEAYERFLRSKGFIKGVSISKGVKE